MPEDFSVFTNTNWKGLESKIGKSFGDLYRAIDENKVLGDALYEINKWNPIANVANGISTYATGYDTYGVKQCNTHVFP